MRRAVHAAFIVKGLTITEQDILDLADHWTLIIIKLKKDKDEQQKTTHEPANNTICEKITHGHH